MSVSTEPLRVAVLLSGRGSNLGALIKASQRDLPIALVGAFSNKSDAPGLGLAAAAGIPTQVLESRLFPDRAEFEQALFAALLLHQENNLSPLLRQETPLPSEREVKIVEDYMRAHAHENITIADLVQAAGVSARSLFEKFRSVRGTTPMQYLRRLRLDQVRRELTSGAPEISVTEVAMRWNFEQLGRFAQYYRRIYGETPSQTLRDSGARNALRG